MGGLLGLGKGAATQQVATPEVSPQIDFLTGQRERPCIGVVDFPETDKPPRKMTFDRL